ncbi:hypothetical protein PIIN_10961 [Serendipita indica DSM 11827]|uniref:Uncharacterized protein n=1 Tax=Serendipita indica (strain DSM 11827) TaxID=1109443 RepID=G4U085_SERID|nr:hypothetical protein PIIN_10961 [Serendipita indica DSM 11827]
MARTGYGWPCIVSQMTLSLTGWSVTLVMYDTAIMEKVEWFSRDNHHTYERVRGV